MDEFSSAGLLFLWSEWAGALRYAEVRRTEKNEQRVNAKLEYIERMSRKEKVSLKEMAERLGVKYGTLIAWKKRDKWDESIPPPPKRKRGGQPGNKNSKGHRNAAGHHKGAPLRNKNAEKDGAYSTVYFDMLTDEEREFIDKTPLEAREALEHEMKILKFREHKIMAKIEEYEKAGNNSTYLNSVTEIAGGNGETTYRVSESAFKRVQSLQDALYKVQGRIAKIADSFRVMDENTERLSMERERLDILRMRATGAVEVEGLDSTEDLTEIETEDIEE